MRNIMFIHSFGDDFLIDSHNALPITLNNWWTGVPLPSSPTLNSRIDSRTCQDFCSCVLDSIISRPVRWPSPVYHLEDGTLSPWYIGCWSYSEFNSLKQCRISVVLSNLLPVITMSRIKQIRTVYSRWWWAHWWSTFFNDEWSTLDRVCSKHGGSMWDARLGGKIARVFPCQTWMNESYVYIDSPTIWTATCQTGHLAVPMSSDGMWLSSRLNWYTCTCSSTAQLYREMQTANSKSVGASAVEGKHNWGGNKIWRTLWETSFSACS